MENIPKHSSMNWKNDILHSLANQRLKTDSEKRKAQALNLPEVNFSDFCLIGHNKRYHISG